jgi:hypothetical protein
VIHGACSSQLCGLEGSTVQAAICSSSAGFFGGKTQPTVFRFLLQISANWQKICVVG